MKNKAFTRKYNIYEQKPCPHNGKEMLTLYLARYLTTDINDLDDQWISLSLA